MRSGFLKTLKFQISSALFLLLVLFAGSMLFTFHQFEKREHDTVILNLAAKLQLTAERMNRQGMNYLDNAPRDYPTYYRDVRLYYRDLMAHVAVFDDITGAFMNGSFTPNLTGLESTVHPLVDHETRSAVEQIEATWAQYRDGLMRALGDDVNEPRLEYAAQHVVKHGLDLERAADNLFSQYQRQVSKHIRQITQVNRAVLFVAMVIALAIIIWFYVTVLRPLALAAEGFQKVSRGDFGHQVPVGGDNEIGWMTGSFNDLSVRLNALFRLMDRIQSGSDLDSTLRFVWEEFSTFLPIDWVGSLFLTADGKAMVLERAFADAQAQVGEHQQYSLDATLLGKAMTSGEPVHVADLKQRASENPAWQFAGLLADKGMHSAILLPLIDQTSVPSLLAFATRQKHAYTPEHLELLTNIAHLVAHSFGRTVRLVEQARLAAIGEFASGIVHEIRNPLATISLALDYFKRSELPEAAERRADLAAGEAERMERLLEDILLYAKPIELKLESLSLQQVLDEFLDANRSIAEPRGQTLTLQAPDEQPTALVDRDRLTQVLLNLLRNACEAAPENSTISWELEENRETHQLSLSVHNRGEPISPEALERVTEPFYTTRSAGTGLGLSIVKRIVDAHRGEISITSDAESGTRVSIALPSGFGN